MCVCFSLLGGLRGEWGPMVGSPTSRLRTRSPDPWSMLRILGVRAFGKHRGYGDAPACSVHGESGIPGLRRARRSWVEGRARVWGERQRLGGRGQGLAVQRRSPPGARQEAAGEAGVGRARGRWRWRSGREAVALAVALAVGWYGWSRPGSASRAAANPGRAWEACHCFPATRTT